jgi:hypothetical protein
MDQFNENVRTWDMEDSMKRLIVLAAMAMLLTGCMGTENYYKAQMSYYEAQAMAYQAQAEAQANRPPLAEMVAPDGTRFVVNQTGDMPVPVIRTTQNPIVEGLKTVVNSTPLAIVAGGWTAGEVLKHATGDINASGGSTVTSTSNSHNSTDLRNADGNVSEDNSNNSTNDSYNQTADPTVVNAPDPTIVTQPDPVIVQPADPIIVPPADPVIIEQPPYNDPVIIPAPDPVIVDKEVVIVGQEAE